MERWGEDGVSGGGLRGAGEGWGGDGEGVRETAVWGCRERLKLRDSVRRGILFMDQMLNTIGVLQCHVFFCARLHSVVVASLYTIGCLLYSAELVIAMIP